jgi:hypothetical protein
VHSPPEASLLSTTTAQSISAGTFLQDVKSSASTPAAWMEVMLVS